MRIWVARTSKCLHRLAPPVEKHQQLWDAAFSPDGSLITVGSGKEHVYVWDVSTGVLVHKIGGFHNWIRSLAFAPDGRSLAAGGGSGTFRIFNVESGECRQYWQSGDANEDHPSIYKCEVRNVHWLKDAGGSPSGRRTGGSSSTRRRAIASGASPSSVHLYSSLTRRFSRARGQGDGARPAWARTSVRLWVNHHLARRQARLPVHPSSKTVRVWRLGD